MVMIGARTDQYPFSKGKQLGYASDICRSILAHLRTSSSSLPARIDLVPLSPANRVAMILNGTCDMECDLTTKTTTRDEQVEFLDSIFFGRAEILTRAESGVSNLEGLRSKRVIALVGSSNMQVAADLDARTISA